MSEGAAAAGDALTGPAVAGITRLSAVETVRARIALSVELGLLSPGDALVCCSDGLLDVLDLDDPFGQVSQVLRDRGPEGAVAEALRLARGEAATDDITVVVLRRDA